MLYLTGITVYLRGLKLSEAMRLLKRDNDLSVFIECLKSHVADTIIQLS